MLSRLLGGVVDVRGVRAGGEDDAGADAMQVRSKGSPSRPERASGRFGQTKQQVLPIMAVCETERAAINFAAAAGSLPMLAASEASALSGPLTGERTVWMGPDQPVTLRCQD